MDMNLGKLQETALQRGLVCCSPRGHKESDTTWRLNNNSNNMNRNSQISLCHGGNMWRSSPSLWLHTAQIAWLFPWFLPSNSWVLLDSCWFSSSGSPGWMLWVSVSFSIRMRQPSWLPLPLSQCSWAQQSHPASWVLRKCPRCSITPSILSAHEMPKMLNQLSGPRRCLQMTHGAGSWKILLWGEYGRKVSNGDGAKSRKRKNSVWWSN